MILVPPAPQLRLYGPPPEPLSIDAPSKLHVYVAVPETAPVKVTDTSCPTHALAEGLSVKAGVSPDEIVVFTELLAVHPPSVTVRKTVSGPVEAQLIEYGPEPAPLTIFAPLKFQL